jgi:lipid A 3-O-deacylase
MLWKTNAQKFIRDSILQHLHMSNKKTALAFFVLFSCLFSIAQDKAQLVDNCSECTSVCNDRSSYLRLYTENDFWKLRGSTDRYFTNGVKIDFFFLPPGTKKGILDKIFFVLPFERDGQPNATRNNNFAMSFGMNQYTPLSIKRTTIDSNDRPYAGWMFLALKCISNDFGRSERLSTEYSFGVIGPAAHQKFVQTKFHEWTGDQKPMGWDYQIHNDPAINLNLVYEKGVVNPAPNIEMMGNFEANIGTVTNYFGLGATFRVGLFNDYFLNEFGLRQGKNKVKRYTKCTDPKKRTRFYSQNLDRKFQFYAYIKPSFRIVIDNSLLEGGIFHYDESPYVLRADRLKRFYAHSEFGFCLAYRGVGLTFSQLFRTPEFDGAFDTHWGALTLTTKLTR